MDFNPRTREGCDGNSDTAYAGIVTDFNPRTREGCDVAMVPEKKGDEEKHFNPRTREGCDGLQIGSVTICSLINHIAN